MPGEEFASTEADEPARRLATVRAEVMPMMLRSIRALVAAAVALLMVAGTTTLSSAQGAPTLQITPSSTTVGGEFRADLVNCFIDAAFFFDIVNGDQPIIGDRCDTGSDGTNVATVGLDAPSTPGQYTVKAIDAHGNEVASATLTVTAANPGPGPVAICAQAIAEAGTGVGSYGSYKLVQAPARGRARNDVVVGTAGDDVLVGGSGNDVLCGLGGDDVLSGESGNDHLDGGPDDDALSGGSGDDHVDGGAGIDTLNGGSGNDTLINGETND